MQHVTRPCVLLVKSGLMAQPGVGGWGHSGQPPRRLCCAPARMWLWVPILGDRVESADPRIAPGRLASPLHLGPLYPGALPLTTLVQTPGCAASPAVADVLE